MHVWNPNARWSHVMDMLFRFVLKNSNIKYIALCRNKRWFWAKPLFHLPVHWSTSILLVLLTIKLFFFFFKVYILFLSNKSLLERESWKIFFCENCSQWVLFTVVHHWLREPVKTGIILKMSKALPVLQRTSLLHTAGFCSVRTFSFTFTTNIYRQRQSNTPQVCGGEVSQVLPSCCCQTVQPALLPTDLTLHITHFSFFFALIGQFSYPIFIIY